LGVNGDNMIDKAKRPRRSLHLPSSIRCPEHPAVINCTVRQLSQDEAVIEIENPNSIPQEFELFVGPTLARHYCAVVWRKKTRLRVAFV
jgi:hypothetical protein